MMRSHSRICGRSDWAGYRFRFIVSNLTLLPFLCKWSLPVRFSEIVFHMFGRQKHRCGAVRVLNRQTIGTAQSRAEICFECVLVLLKQEPQTGARRNSAWSFSIAYCWNFVVLSRIFGRRWSSRKKNDKKWRGCASTVIGAPACSCRLSLARVLQYIEGLWFSVTVYEE